MSKRKRSSAALAISTTSSVEEVCDWAGCAVTAGGGGLDNDDVAILRREKINGRALLSLTDDAELKEDGMSLGPRVNLLAAVTLLREPTAAWKTRSVYVAYQAEKRSHPVFTVYAGPGSGKSRLLSELPRLARAAVRDNADLQRLLDPALAYVFHIGFENGTAYQNSERDGVAAVANRMMWQLMRPKGVTHDFAAFASRHAYSIDDALDKLSELTGRPRVEQPVFLLVDGMRNLCAPTEPQSVFSDAVKAVSTIVCSEQFIVSAIAATSGLQLETLFGASKQARIFLRPHLLPHPELVVPDDSSFPALRVLRNDMGGHGRALDILAKLVQTRKSPGKAQSIEALSSAVQSQLLLDYSEWIFVQPLEELLEAIISRRPFKSLKDYIVGGITVDRARELGLVQWAGSSVSAPGPLIAPVILLLMLQSRLPGKSLLTRLASGYNKLEFGWRSGNWWQDFEEFAAVYRAIKVKAFRGVGWVSVAQLHYGARFSPAANALLIRTPASSRDVAVIHASQRYPTKSSADVRLVIPWVKTVGNPRRPGAPVDITDGASVVLNGTSASAADVFLDVEIVGADDHSTPRTCRELFACRHREEDVNSADFALERDKAADKDDLFIFFTTKIALVDLDSTDGCGGSASKLERKKQRTAVGSKPVNYSAALVGVVDASCFEAYFGFGGRAFVDAEAPASNDGALTNRIAASSAFFGAVRASVSDEEKVVTESGKFESLPAATDWTRVALETNTALQAQADAAIARSKS